MAAVHKFAKRNVVDVMMFTWVFCFRANFPTVTIEKGILNFMKHNGITEDQFNLDSERVKYGRMEKEFRDMQRTEGLLTN